MFAQVYGEGDIHVLFEEIADHKNEGSEVNNQDDIFTTVNGNKLRQETTKC